MICNWSTVTANACFDAGDGPPHPDNDKPSCSVPLFKVTEVQLKDESFIEQMVFIVQDVWHSKQRIVKQLPRGHANWHACNADLSHVYKQCRPSADGVGMLKGENGEELKKEITQAATQFTASLDDVFRRYSEFVPVRKNSSLSDSISMISQVYKSKQTPAAGPGHASRCVTEGSTPTASLVGAGAPNRSLFRARKVETVTSQETFSHHKVPSSAM